jgi:predicted MFS family arabinose efflux permease
VKGAKLVGAGGTRSVLKGIMALLACFVFNMGIMAVWAYLERMGHAAGLEPVFIGRALALSLFGALFGALVAAALADRYGRILPLIVTLVIQVIAVVLLNGELTESAFLAGVILFAFAWNFPVAYQLAITVSVDVSGRLVVLFLSAVKLGYAVAPVIAAQLFLLGGAFLPVLILAMAAFLVSALIFAGLARSGRNAPQDEHPNRHARL